MGKGHLHLETTVSVLLRWVPMEVVMVAGIEEEKAMSHIWVDTGTEEKAEQPCAECSPRCHEAGN